MGFFFLSSTHDCSFHGPRRATSFARAVEHLRLMLRPSRKLNLSPKWSPRRRNPKKWPRKPAPTAASPMLPVTASVAAASPSLARVKVMPTMLRRHHLPKRLRLVRRRWFFVVNVEKKMLLAIGSAKSVAARLLRPMLHPLAEPRPHRITSLPKKLRRRHRVRIRLLRKSRRRTRPRQWWKKTRASTVTQYCPVQLLGTA